ncbi:MAG: C-GCAxxG-C-C family protein [Dictyoglomaceae bacterium]
MDKVEKALSIFNKSFNCSQSVFTAFSEDFGLDEKTALLIASGLGGGIGRTGRICGAVSGAILVLGLKYGFFEEEDIDSGKERIYPKVKEFIKEFETIYRSINCIDLLGGVDLGTEEGLKKAKEENLFKTICPKYVETACKILEKLL